MRSDAGLAEKVRFLSGAGACEEGLPPRAVETHMSWVFLCSGRVLKLKKPVRYDFLDFSSLAARRFNCREEVRLNRRLAPDVYLGVAPLTQRSDGQFEVGPIDPMDAAAAAPTADPEGTADWLVVMRRLPAARMLDSALAAGTCTAADIDRLAERLAEHEAGSGARLTQVQLGAGGTWRLASVEPGGRLRERQLKQHGAARRCPICIAGADLAEPEPEAGP